MQSQGLIRLGHVLDFHTATVRMPRVIRLGFPICLVLSAFFSAHAATFTVTNTADSGLGSLTQAILDANANPGPDDIVFAIPPFDTSVKTITYTATPPPITDPVVINGYSQPNTVTNTLAVGHNAVLLVRIHEPSGTAPLTITASDSQIRGLIFDGLAVVVAGSSNVVLAGNFFGVAADGVNPGTTAVPFNIVILVGDNHRVGGPRPADRNLIATATDAGILLSEPGPVQVIENNYIGTQRNGQSPLGNTGDGIEISFGDGSLIVSNVIAHNGGAGILIGGGTAQTITGNRVFSNGGLGIDLVGVSGPEINDPCDTDSGANELQNYPVLVAATGTVSSLTVTGVLNSAIFTDYVIELFANPTCDSSGFGEGAVPLGTTVVTTDGNCAGAFVVTLPVSVTNAPIITATATDPAGNTSEFSECITATLDVSADIGVAVVDTPDPVFAFAPLTHTIIVTNAGPNPAPSVIVSNSLPVGATFNSAVPSAGTCTNIGSLVVCSLGTLQTNTTATITIVSTPTIAGTASNLTLVSSEVPDPFLANNAALTLTTVNDAGCASNVTSLVSVRVGRLLHNFRTRRCYHRVTIRNTGSQPINGPIHLVLLDLPSGATLLNGTGTTACPLAPGLPYRTVRAVTTPLRPGRTISTVLEYRLEPEVCPTFVPRVLAGPGTP